ncbi:MAG: hypothetical protein EOM55_02165 [Clostridia bacterium]|nr:hypothetical protein [Clostridia bacterium]
MRNHKFKSIITSSILFLLSFCCFYFVAPNASEVISANAFSNSVTNTGITEDSKQYSYTNSSTGNIPFSLFTSAPSATNNEYIITDYLPTFTATTSTNNTYYYSMNDDTVPYIVLSSSSPDDLLYKTLFFRFNDANGATTSTTAQINSIAVQGTVRTASSDDEISLYCPTDQTTSTNTRYSFAVNLLSLVTNDQANPDAECPFVLGETTLNKLGGNGAENDVSFRTGLYSFIISYTFTRNGAVSNSCVFELSFYIIDYDAYIDNNTNPLIFSNTDTYQYRDEATNTTYDTDYELYNYNYDDEPVIEYDASKFGLDFSFTSGSNIYNFTYASFTYNVPSGYTGKVTLDCTINNLLYQYSFYTKQVGNVTYSAYFDFADFQKNMIVKNSTAFKTNSFQGVYAFSLNILIPTSSSENFITIPSFILDDTVDETLNCKKLAIFGYELKYTDYTTSERLALVKYDDAGNLITKSSVVAKNDHSANYYVSVPESIAITNQKNLRFDNFGNLTSSYTAKYLLLNYNQLSNDDILNTEENYFGLIKSSTPETLSTNLATLDTLINASDVTYTQGSPITVDGIYIMKLVYSISIDIDFSNGNLSFQGSKSVMGEQYIVFEVNNNIQKLNIQAINTSTQYLYDFNTYTNQSVRIGIKDMPNAFFLPTVVSYTRSANFSSTSSNSGVLSLKANTTYLVDGTSYRYYVTNSSNNFTFSQDGLYTVTIRIATTSTTSSETYTFYIDSDTNKISGTSGITNAQKITLNDASITSAVINDGKYIKTTDYVAKETSSDLYITAEPFSLSWKPSDSGAREYCYVSYMEQTETSNDLSLFKENTSQYWLTNSFEFSSILNNVESGYVNSYTLNVGSELSAKSYFRKDGIYFFFIYDQAGNNFYLTVLVDSSNSSILQGKWASTSENSSWINTYDKTNNESNYVNSDTVLYFGTHKALLLPNLSAGTAVTVTNPSYTACYDLSTGILATKTNYNVDFYQILSGITSYVCTNSTSDLLDFGGANANDINYYLILSNTSVTESTTSSTFTTPSTIYRSVIYNVTSLTVPFKGENNYFFTVTNKTGVATQRRINMNFDVIQGTFYAYNSIGEQYVITQGAGTNLNVLKFSYTKNNSSAASYYNVASLYYEYYNFALTEDDPNYSSSSYPFSSSVTYQDNLFATPDEGGVIFSVDSINVTYDSGLGLSGVTKPGKYVITRVYQGGTHKRVDNGDGTYSFILESGGDYYTNDGGETFIYLFGADSKVRRYTVYVDHNGIITEATSNRDAVGDNISIILGTDNSVSNQWTFKEFYKTSLAGNSLTTNKVPVQINVPYSKYFLNTSSSYVFSNLNFAKLSVKIYYSSGTANITYVSNVNTYNVSTGMLTCSALVSSKNPSGNLLFSNEGRYNVVITDKTETTPTTYSFVFYITYSSPEISIYTHSFSSSTFSNTLLTNEDSSNNFATNIKAVNDSPSLEDNKIYLKWNDPSTPYLAQIDKITVSVQNSDSTTSSYSIILSELNKNTIISSINGEVNLSLGDSTNLITSGQFVLSFHLAYYNPTSPYETFDSKNYYRYSYQMALSIANEVKYTIVVSYISILDNSESYDRNDDTSFADSTYTVTIDRTKPNVNINRLINSESLLMHYFTNTSEFKEENYDYEANGTSSDPTSLTYAFGINSSFALTYSSSETLNYFYIRSYDKYNGDYSSITPDMIDTIYPSSHAYYENQLYFSGYPRFSEIRLISDTINIGTETYYKIYYNLSTSLYSLIKSTLGIENPTGFYEVIEKDSAGNYRSFSVYFSSYSNTYEIINVDGIHENGYATMSGNAITAKEYFTLTSLSSRLGFGYVTLRNETLGTNFSSVIELSPVSTSISSQMLTRINAFLTCEINSRFSFTLSRYNSTFPLSTVYINVITNDSTAYLSSPTVQESSSSTGTTYNLVLTTSTATTFLYLERFSLYVYSNNAWQATSHIYTSNIPSNITGLSSGIYKAVYKDNYNANTYFFILYIGEFYINNFSKEVVFSLQNYIYDSENKMYYSGDDVQITYEANIYQVRVNGVLYSGTNLETLSSKYSSYNCKTFTLSSDYSYNNVDAEYSVGGVTTYEIVYYDITDGSIQKTLNITIFDYLPEIILTNENDGSSSITSTLQESESQITNAIVNIDYGTIGGCAYAGLNDSSTNNVTVAKLYTRNDEGEYASYKIISAGEVVSEEGYYRLDISNSKLANMRSIYFVIQFGDFPLYTVYANEAELSPSSQEILNLSSTTTANSSKFNSSSASQTVIQTIYQALTSLNTAGYLNDIVDRTTSLPKTEYDILISNLGFTSSGVFSASNIGIANILNVEHFYSIYSPSIVYNSNIKLNIIEFVFTNDILTNYFLNDEGINTTPSNVGRDYWTTIYLVYNLTGPIRIELFAFTKVPTSTSLISGNIYYNSTEVINLTSSSITLEKVLTNSEITNSTTLISWNMLPSAETAKWFKQGNFVYLLEQYSLNDTYYSINFAVNTATSVNSSTISGSGTHKIMFKDIAGNTHQFTTSSFVSEKNVFKIHLLDQVIYYLTQDEEDRDPIQYAIFNSPVEIILDQYYLSLLSNIKIRVTLNGTSTTNFTTNGNVYTFSNAGKYIVKFDGKYNGKDLNTATYNFSIINANASRLSFEYPSIKGYKITKVIKDSRNITSSILASDGSLFVTASDSLSGSGHYTVTLKYGQNANDVIEFSFLISEFVPTISCNINYGETTTSNIILSYNGNYIYSQIGQCSINILVYNSDSNTFYTYQTISISDASSTGNSTITLSNSNSYFVQVKTENGNVISSFRVNKTDPLNSFAIIAIIIASIAGIVLLIVIIKLRTKMKVR